MAAKNVPGGLSPLYDELLLWTRANLTTILREANARTYWTSAAIARWRDGAQQAVREAANQAAWQVQCVRRVLTGKMPDDLTAVEMGWVLDPAEELPARSRLAYPVRWTKEDQAEVRRVVKALRSWPGLGDPPPPGDVALGTVRLQQPVLRGPVIVGYIDVQAGFNECRLVVANVTHHDEYEYHHEPWRLDCLSRWHGGLPTMADLWLPEWSTTVRQWEEDLQTACILVRPEIPSLTELLREVRSLATYAPGDYMVVSPDDRYAEVLQEQGITLVPYRAEAEAVAVP